MKFFRIYNQCKTKAKSYGGRPMVNAFLEEWFSFSLLRARDAIDKFPLSLPYGRRYFFFFNCTFSWALRCSEFQLLTFFKPKSLSIISYQANKLQSFKILNISKQHEDTHAFACGCYCCFNPASFCNFKVVLCLMNSAVHFKVFVVFYQAF